MSVPAKEISGESDSELLSAIAAGDRRALKVLYLGYQQRLARFLLRITQCRENIEEIINDTFMVGMAGTNRRSCVGGGSSRLGDAWPQSSSRRATPGFGACLLHGVFVDGNRGHDRCADRNRQGTHVSRAAEVAPAPADTRRRLRIVSGRQHIFPGRDLCQYACLVPGRCKCIAQYRSAQSRLGESAQPCLAPARPIRGVRCRRFS
jgi:hypothetical protein